MTKVIILLLAFHGLSSLTTLGWLIYNYGTESVLSLLLTLIYQRPMVVIMPISADDNNTLVFNVTNGKTALEMADHLEVSAAGIRENLKDQYNMDELVKSVKKDMLK